MAARRHAQDLPPTVAPHPHRLDAPSALGALRRCRRESASSPGTGPGPSKTPSSLLRPAARFLDDAETGSCEHCITRAQSDLRDVVGLSAVLRDELGQLRGLAHDRDRRGSGAGHGRPLPGGDVMVTLGPGAEGTHDHAGVRDDDPVSIVGLLTRGTRTTGGTPAGSRPPQASRVASESPWGRGRLPRATPAWAAVNHPAFGDFARDLRTARTRLQSVAGRSERKVRAPADCFDCGGRSSAAGPTRVWRTTGPATGAAAATTTPATSSRGQGQAAAAAAAAADELGACRGGRRGDRPVRGHAASLGSPRRGGHCLPGLGPHSALLVVGR